MKLLSFVCFLLIINAGTVSAQHEAEKDTSWKNEYRETPARINNLVHTKLDLKPDFSKSWLHGKAWLTLKPHFYSTDSLTLDAKGMELKEVSLIKAGRKVPLKYIYDDFEVRIKLDRSYTRNESYQVFVDYIAKPDEFEEKYGQGAMLGIKGMYFIDPRDEDPEKPTQIWTQGETESGSAWFPTIDKTNQKTTQELSVTVNNKYVTLSNGKLVSQKKNTDGTRTDTWKMDLPHAPYLFFLGVGEYAVVKDNWKGKEVSYYVEPQYGPVARKIFGHTPEMMTFFSRITGIDYPWVKYAQITGRDYMAGAMENTTATIHQESAQQDARELIDGNIWEATIAHELFHHWFGDLVTTESWSNLTLNESFADYSQTLWAEYKYGKDAGDAENYQGMQGYLQSGSDHKTLVRFHYAHREDMFDAVSYNKGGRILHMLRRHVGDSAFFKTMNLYLNTYKFKSAEAHQLRQAFEEVTGRDLNWFFNQWYFDHGHPQVDIKYKYDDAAGKVQVIIEQKQEHRVFRLPLAIDVYQGAVKTRHQVWASNRIDSFQFDYKVRPELVNVDAEKIMLWEKNDQKTLDQYIHQYKYAGNFMDRLEAIQYASQHATERKAIDLFKLALKDPYHGLRMLTLNIFNPASEAVKKEFQPILEDLAKNDKKSLVRGLAIGKLGTYNDPQYLDFFRASTRDSSYTVAGNAIEALYSLQPEEAMKLAVEMRKKPNKGVLRDALTTIVASSGDESLADEIIGGFASMPLSQAKFQAMEPLNSYLMALKNPSLVKSGVEEIVKFRDAIPEGFRGQTDPYINGMILQSLLAKKAQDFKSSPMNKELKDLLDYLVSVLPEENKKGF